MPDRNLLDVIKAIINEVPGTETDLLAVLDDLRSSVEFAAPEMIPMWWGELCDTLEDNLGQPDVDWKWKIAMILKGDSDDAGRDTEAKTDQIS